MALQKISAAKNMEYYVISHCSNIKVSSKIEGCVIGVPPLRGRHGGDNPRPQTSAKHERNR